MNNFIWFVLSLILFGCQSKTDHSIILDGGIRAVGNIGSDSVFNGVIKFYDNKSNTLVSR